MARHVLPPEALEFFQKQGAKGGKLAAAGMTPRQRVARAKKAVGAREAKRGKPGRKR